MASESVVSRRTIVRTFVATVIATLSATHIARAAEDMEVKIGYYAGAVLQSLLFVADAKGFYKDAGLNPSFLPVASGPLVNSQIASGAIDFGFNTPPNIALARERGLDQVFILGNVTMPYVLIARPDVKLPNKGKYPAVMKDLKGLNWGVFARGADTEMFLRIMASDAKLDTDKDMTWIGVGPPATGLPALKARQIDVYMAIDPAPIAAAVAGYGQTVVDLRKGEGPADFKDIPYQGIVALRKTAESRPKAVEAIATAHARAYCWIRDTKNLDELLGILRNKLPVGDLSEAQFRQMVQENISTFTLTFPGGPFKVWNDMFMSAKILKTPVPADAILWKSIPRQDPKC
jgi:ABC-type nitrate/sulfonate/bicarbonate transport system substrate-binding protein